jgi:diguanylate cyclase (GGDEF)-like protein
MSMRTRYAMVIGLVIAGWAGAVSVLWTSRDPGDGLAAGLVYALSSVLIILAVGGIAATEREVRVRYAEYLNVVQHVEVALYVFAPERDGGPDSLHLVAANPAGLRLTSPDLGDLDPIGRPLVEVAPGLDAASGDLTCQALFDVIRTGQGFRYDELRFVPSDPNAPTYAADVFPLPGGSVGVSLLDITAQVQAAAGLRHQAHHDGLTGLPNRSYLTDLTRRSLRISSKTRQPLALLVMDLDQFKEINDALGHDHGDRLLVELSHRLQHVLAPHARLVARLGGDEFAVLLTHPGDLDAALATAAAIRHAMAKPFQLGGISLHVSASIGIAVYPDHAVDAETLARRADVAMYHAKRTGAGTAVYDPEHDQSSVRRLAMLGELRRAIAHDELVLHYQPSVDLASGRPSGAEALVRWQHPVHGLLAPVEFIGLAEMSGVIQELTRWVLDRAVRDLAAWALVGVTLPVAVNLSVRNLYDVDLPLWLGRLLEEQGVEASMLTLEITESVLMDDQGHAADALARLREMGTSSSIDDFGTGFSSLANLRHLPVDEVKIDRSFVGGMVADTIDLTIVRSVIELAHGLELRVVAEGVEDAETLARLTELGCDRAQGYHLSRPLTAEALLRWLDAKRGGGLVHTTRRDRPGGRWQAI